MEDDIADWVYCPGCNGDSWNQGVCEGCGWTPVDSDYAYRVWRRKKVKRRRVPRVWKNCLWQYGGD